MREVNDDNKGGRIDGLGDDIDLHDFNDMNESRTEKRLFEITTSSCSKVSHPL